MDSDSRALVTFLLGTAVSLCILAGLATKYVLVPYLRVHLITPVEETHKQVTENGQQTNPNQPTVLDAIHDVQSDVNALSNVMDVHMEWSEKQTKATERKLKLLRRTIQRHHPKETENRP